jgi:DHA2 family multidrug resistance protein
MIGWFNNKLIVLLSAVSVFGVILFIWRQLTYKYPIVLSVLKDGNLRIGTLWLLGFGLYGSTLIIPIYTQSILGLNICSHHPAIYFIWGKYW